jgi:RimJ/RimL family protein N-acetyltransferase
MQLSHRLANSNDLQAIHELYMEPSSNAFLTYDPMSLELFADLFEKLLQEKNLYVVEAGGEIVATYRLIQKSHRQSHILYLGGFSVKRSMMGKGFGFRILEFIKAKAKTKLFSRIELTVDTENHGAIALYRKVGFEIEGKLKNNYRLASTGRLYDEYVMALLLN